MKLFKLTEEHKSKLLEMCKVLFPGFKIGKAVNMSTDNVFILYMSIGDHISWIHWYEFCTTHLVNKLAFESVTSDLVGDIQYEEARLKYLLELSKDRPEPGPYHPVDYLYKQFKKIENETV